RFNNGMVAHRKYDMWIYFAIVGLFAEYLYLNEMEYETNTACARIYEKNIYMYTRFYVIILRLTYSLQKIQCKV
ncbi:MAG: hypothetical protein N0C90_26335, partial [Candidatus Thiodiazotropha endolucinida]|nr:hypothetical protein [Candidatus Thiodiazotropha taylori]MCW4264867.1 hypothetical protein [Candidatus Thiodiazotropha endolucinida]